MYARSTTLQGKPNRIDEAIDYVRNQVMPALLDMNGCVGVSMLVDRETGSGITSSAWETADAMRATAHNVGTMRDRAEQIFGGRADVREWEIAVLHRARPVTDGGCARVTWTRVPPQLVDDQLYLFRVGTLPQIEDLPGFCSASVFVQRDTGKAAIAVTYENRDCLLASRDPASDIRADASASMGAQILDVCEFDVAIAHLRVPETV